MSIRINSAIAPEMRVKESNKHKRVQKKIQEENKDGRKKLALTLLAAGAIAIAAIAIKKRPISINRFKEIGTFEDGMAIKKGLDGVKRGYNGTIKVPSKNGDVTVLKYVNGIIKSSIKKSSDGKIIFEKTYNNSLKEGQYAVSSVRTQMPNKITEFIKNKNGHTITENGIIKKALIEKNNGEKIIADFKDGKPVSSLKYRMEAKGSKALLSTKTYYQNGKIHEIKTDTKKIVFAKENRTFPFNSDSIQIKYNENHEPKNILYMQKGKPVCQKDVEYNNDFIPNINTQGDFKTAKHITTYVSDEVAPFEKVGEELFGGRKIEEKYVYSNASSDIVREGSLSQYSPSSTCELEHINHQGKTTGFSRVEFSKDYLSFNVGDRLNTRITEYPCSHKEYDANHKLIDVWFGLVKNAYQNTPSNIELP